MELQISIKDEKLEFFLDMLKEFNDTVVSEIKILDDNKDKKKLNRQRFDNFLKMSKDIESLKPDSRDALHER